MLWWVIALRRRLVRTTNSVKLSQGATGAGSFESSRGPALQPSLLPRRPNPAPRQVGSGVQRPDRSPWTPVLSPAAGGGNLSDLAARRSPAPAQVVRHGSLDRTGGGMGRHPHSRHCRPSGLCSRCGHERVPCAATIALPPLPLPQVACSAPSLAPPARFILPASLPPDAVEGVVFALSPRSIATVLAAELAAFGIVAGPRAPLKVAAGTLFAMGTVQTWRWLILVRQICWMDETCV